MNKAIITVAALALSAIISAPAMAESAIKTQATFSTGTSTLGDLLDNPASRAILDKHLPGISNDPQAVMGRSMTLRQIQPYASDKFTDTVLTSIDADLTKIAPMKP